VIRERSPTKYLEIVAHRMPFQTSRQQHQRKAVKADLSRWQSTECTHPPSHIEIGTVT